MQLDNFEKQTQQKLSNREIKPSANSWDRLDAMLSVEEKPKKKGFFWINIAASFIVFASIGYYFYNQNTIVEPLKEESIIVEENSEFRIQNSENNQENKDVLEEKQEARNKKQEVLVENDNLIKKSQNQSTINNQQSLIVNQGVSIINQSKENNNNQKIVVDNIKPENQKTETTSNKYISAEKLLAEISNSKKDTSNSFIQINKRGKSRISVNSQILLADAEKEIDKTFKATILKKLNKNYQEITTAIANRNYEE